MKFTVDWYGCDQDGWWVDFFEDGKEVDSSEFDNWESMQDSCNQWYGRNESDLTEEDTEVGMAYPDYLKKYQAMFPYVATTETFGLLWQRDCIEWLVKNIGRHSVDFYNSSDCIVFKRQEDCVLFSMTWL